MTRDQLRLRIRKVLQVLAGGNPHFAAVLIDEWLDPLDDSPEMLALYRGADALDRGQATDAVTILHGALAVQGKDKNA